MLSLTRSLKPRLSTATGLFAHARAKLHSLHHSRFSAWELFLPHMRIMAEVQAQEGWLQTPDNLKLYTKAWHPPTSTSRARLVFIHGFSDHCNSYGLLFPYLAQKGIKVYSFDQRGWGRSVQEPSQKGLTGPTSKVMQDITTFIGNLPTEESGTPLFLMGHSMGGAETLIYAAMGPREVVSKIRGFLVESPFIALHPSARPWTATVMLGRLAGRIWPHRHMVQKLDARKVSRDQDVCKAWEQDSLCHDTGTLEGLAGMLDRAADLEENKVILREGLGEYGQTRLWVSHGTADGICGYEACRKWYESVKIEDKEMRIYEGWYHKLHAEPGEDKVTFAGDVGKWILDRCELQNREEPAEARAKL